MTGCSIIFFINTTEMTKNLEAADHIVKLVLAISIIVLYVVRVIAGPFAIALVVLSFFILGSFAARLIIGAWRHGKKGDA